MKDQKKAKPINKPINKKDKMLILALAFSSISLGCTGRMTSPSLTSAPPQSYVQSYGASSYRASSTLFQGTHGTYSCDQTDNVSTSNSLSAIGNTPMLFTVCPSAQSIEYSKILVRGTGTVPKSICVFPAQNSANRGAVWYQNPQKLSLLYQCGELNPQGTYGSGSTSPLAEFSFQTELVDPEFNSVYIVDQSDLNPMLSCLWNHTTSNSCPPFAFGVFK